MKFIASIAAALSLAVVSSHGLTYTAGSGTFTTQGEIDTFPLYNGDPSFITNVTIRITSTAFANGVTLTSNNADPASFEGTINSNYSVTVLGALSGGTANISDSENSGILTTGQQYTYNLSASTGIGGVQTSMNPLFFSLFAGPGNGNISASTLNSAFSTVSSPLGSAFSQSGGTTGATYTWEVIYTVPEPSAALLGAVGLLALLRRRR